MPGIGLQQQTRKVRGVADIVFCLDCTSSMGGCIEALKKSVGKLVESLGTPRTYGNVVVAVRDWRVRLFPFRDLEVHSEEDAMVETFDFTNNIQVFLDQLNSDATRLIGSVDYPESGLDAIYRAAVRSNWRPRGEANRFVVLFTDDEPKPLHPSTLAQGPRDGAYVAQVLREHRVRPILYALDHPDFRALLADWPQQLRDASRLAPNRDEAHRQLNEADDTSFEALLHNLAKTVSKSIVDDIL